MSCPTAPDLGKTWHQNDRPWARSGHPAVDIIKGVRFKTVLRWRGPSLGGRNAAPSAKNKLQTKTPSPCTRGARFTMQTEMIVLVERADLRANTGSKQKPLGDNVHFNSNHRHVDIIKTPQRADHQHRDSTGDADRLGKSLSFLQRPGWAGRPPSRLTWRTV